MAKARISDRKIRSALNKTLGNILGAATLLGVSREHLSTRIHKNEKLREHLQKTRDRQIDVAEIKLNAALARDERWAIKYVLSTQGKKRGYTTRSELQVNALVDVQIDGVDFSALDDDEKPDA